jgi:hypothetical protein
VSVEQEYDDVFWRAGIARKALSVIDEALYSLKLQRKALEAEVRVREHAFADFILAHGDEVHAINERRADERRAQLEAEVSPCPRGCVGPVGNEQACIQCGTRYPEPVS